MRRLLFALPLLAVLAFACGVRAFQVTGVPGGDAGQGQAPIPQATTSLLKTSVLIQPNFDNFTSVALSPDGLFVAEIGITNPPPIMVPGAAAPGTAPPKPPAGATPAGTVGPPPTVTPGPPPPTIVPAPNYTPNVVSIPSYTFAVHRADTGAQVIRIEQTDLRWLDWSPRSDELAASAVTNAGKNQALVVVSPSGANRRTLTPADKFTEIKFIRWSADASKIAFGAIIKAADPSMNEVGLWVVGSDGSGLSRLFGGPARQIGGSVGRPEWSPDGGTIAFDVGDLGAHAVYVVVPGGQGATRLTASGTYANQPKWSPDGSKIAYAVHTESEPGTLWVMDRTGSNNVKLVKSLTGPVTYLAGWLDNGTIGYLAAGTGEATVELVGPTLPPVVLSRHAKAQAWGVALSANRSVIAGLFQPYVSRQTEIRVLR